MFRELNNNSFTVYSSRRIALAPSSFRGGTPAGVFQSGPQRFLWFRRVQDAARPGRGASRTRRVLDAPRPGRAETIENPQGRIRKRSQQRQGHPLGRTTGPALLSDKQYEPKTNTLGHDLGSNAWV